MSSSTKPPATSRKFQFDTDFEEEDERQRLEVLRQEELRQSYGAQPVAVQYSEDQLVAAREDSYRIGYEQGIVEAKKLLEHNLSAATDRLTAGLQHMLDKEEERWDQSRRIALTATIATLKKCWPQLVRNLGAQAVEETLRHSLDINNDEARIVVRVHDTMLDAVVDKLPQLKEQQAFAGKVIVLADPGVAVGDCKVEWADGGLERLSRNLSRHLDEALNRLLSGLETPAPSSQNNTQTERMSS